MQKLPTILLRKGKDESLKRFHPWVFSGAIRQVEGKIQEGDLVCVQDENRRFLGIGHYAAGSIAVRILSFLNAAIDEDWWIAKLTKAWELRLSEGLLKEGYNNMFRLIHAEGDGLPGLIVDYYDGVVVIQAHSLGMYKALDDISAALRSVLGVQLKGIYNKSSESLSKIKVTTENGWLSNLSVEPGPCFENGLNFKIDWIGGQKTGFFLDQRDNRLLLSKYCKGKSVLNTFCYTGGFSVFALQGGATLVHSLDSSAPALELTEENVNINGFANERHGIIRADAIEYLKSPDLQYDIVVLDPPAFAKRLDARHAAVQAYKRLNYRGILAVKPGGYLFSFSCSQVVDNDLFRHTVRAAAIEAGRDVQLLHCLRQGADHPVSLFHPEGEYLKGVVLKVY
jgi:23S rRNA (cytosine1962-C5)-methyltransferase